MSCTTNDNSVSKLTYLLACLGEECGEVQQVVGKSVRFGVFEVNPKDVGGGNNLYRIGREVHDLLAVYELLCEECGIDFSIRADYIQGKKNKLVKWAKVSTELGVLR